VPQNDKGWRVSRVEECSECVQLRDLLFDAPGSSLKLNQHDFRIRSDPHGWPPSSGATGRIHLHVIHAFQAVIEFSPNARTYPGIRKELPAVGVPRKLQ